MMQFSFISHSGLQTGAFDCNETNDDTSETGDCVPELTSTSMGLIFTIAYDVAGSLFSWFAQRRTEEKATAGEQG